tara:strand:- start:1133 stop:1324 length:192 start_codon:yes stop_codon:yes gene_type:complete
MNHHQSTLKILTDLGINGVKASKAMGISHSLFGNKYNDNQRNKFTEYNYRDLVNWLKLYIDTI